MNTELKILATGLGWLGNGVESITLNTQQMICHAKYEICIAAYNIGPGAISFIELLHHPLSRGVDVRILINKFSKHPNVVKSKLDELFKRYSTITLYDFVHPEGYDLHAKMIIADREKAIIGSSNISKRGFFDNHELAVLMSGNEVLKIANAFESLIRNTMVKKVDL
ncbi:phospholipase D-like domain-containing protein [Paenibacillus sp. CC-CFT742]|nr:phospholipase D-like domain-containing protein [Paenibacillus sp. CC-CFT742]WJH31339.1 phospholipase D-like domain-containing protein [Paenibacillus sp. CC-CFT742]